MQNIAYPLINICKVMKENYPFGSISLSYPFAYCFLLPQYYLLVDKNVNQLKYLSHSEASLEKTL